MVITGLVMALIAGAANRLGGEGTSEELHLPSHASFYGIASIMMFLFGATVGPELLCPDRRNGVISLYLVRPLTGTDYVFARWAALLTVMVAVVWLPQTVLLAGLALGAQNTPEYLKDHWLDIPRFLAAGAVMAIYVTTLALAVASFTSRRAAAAAFLVGLFVISNAVANGVGQSIGGPAGPWLTLFSLSEVPLYVNDIIFAKAAGITEGSRARELPEYVRVGWWVLWTTVPGWVLWQRYRRLSP
jgi:ABC-type transport system involved in multi-copper enzyme maturation permease subunit